MKASFMLLQIAYFFCFGLSETLALLASSKSNGILRSVHCARTLQRHRTLVSNYSLKLRREHASRRIVRLLHRENYDDNDQPEEKDQDGNVDMDATIQAFLDRPFYDPDAVLQETDVDKESIQYRFASFVKYDYETAEALLVGAYMFVLVLVTQQLVRHL